MIYLIITVFPNYPHKLFILIREDALKKHKKSVGILELSKDLTEQINNYRIHYICVYIHTYIYIYTIYK